MFESFIRPFKNLDRSIKVAIAATGATNFGNRMTTKYDPLYAADLGADPVNIGLLNSISSAFSAITSIPLGWAVENYSLKKVMLLPDLQRNLANQIIMLKYQTGFSGIIQIN